MKIDALEDKDLIVLIQGGSKEAFHPLVSRYKNQIFNLIIRSVRDFQLAEEVSQDVFVKAYAGLKQFRFESSFATWLVRIALNTVKTFQTTKYARQRSKTDYFEEEVTSAQESIESVLITKERCTAFHHCYDKLSSKLQQSILLLGLQAYSYEEAAEILSIPIGTVRSRLNQARLLLVRCMTKTLGEAI